MFRGEWVTILTVEIFKDNPIESILDSINDEISNHQAKYIVIAFKDDIKSNERKEIVDRIKNCFDIFIVLNTDIPKSKKDLEKYFSYGVHGLLLNSNSETYSSQQIDIMSFAVELFPRGWVFATTKNNKIMISKLLSLRIIPVPNQYEPKINKLIKSNQYFNKIAPNLKAVPLLDEDQQNYSLTDKIRMKMILESINLRQKLMLKNVEESFESSGL